MVSVSSKFALAMSFFVPFLKVQAVRCACHAGRFAVGDGGAAIVFLITLIPAIAFPDSRH